MQQSANSTVLTLWQTGCSTAAEGVNWILKHEPELILLQDVSPKQVKRLVRAASINTTKSRWQTKVDGDLFNAAMKGDLDEMAVALEWGADINSVHVQGRC